MIRIKQDTTPVLKYRPFARIVFSLLCALPGAQAEITPVLLFSPTAEVSSFDAVAEGDQVWVRWQTSVELGVNAFRVMRQVDGHPSESVGLMRTHGDETGGSYRLADPLVKAGEAVRYALFLESGQDTHSLAVWEGLVEYAIDEPLRVDAAESLAVGALSEPLAAQAWIGNGERVRIWTEIAAADRVRLSLTKEGVYRVTAQELAVAGGWDLSSITNAIDSTNLTLSCQGDPVAWHADGDGLLFHGLPATSRFVPENVYWVEFGAGLSMQTLDGLPVEPATTNAWFVEQITTQGTDYLSRVTRSSLADAPASYLSAAFLTSGAVNELDEPLVDCAAGMWEGMVTVHLVSLFEAGTDDHTARISLGGTPVGEPSWSDEQYLSFTYPFSSTNLTAGTAALSVANIRTPPPVGVTDYTRFLFVSHSFSYPRLYRATNDALRCTGGESNTVAVSGFSTNDVIVLNVTTTNQPVVVEPISFSFDGVVSNWTAAFSCGDTGQVYQVCSRSSGLRQPSVRGVRDVDWTLSSNAADYVILIPPEGWTEGFRPVLQELADYRTAQGLQTTVVDVESLYNQFSYGLADPQAIHEFCISSHTNWLDRPLRYLLLAGDGGIDFKHERFSVSDYTACLIPTIIIGQRFSEGVGTTAAIDSVFGDVDGDGVQDVAVGRFPTTQVEDMETVVQKTMAYEGALIQTNGTLAKSYATVAPDWNNIPASSKYYLFDAAVDRLIEPLQAANRIHIPNRADPDYPNNLAGVKNDSLIPALKEGTGLFHYYGHGNKISLGYSSYYNGLPGSKLLSASDITTNNWQSPTIAVMVGCNVNVWHWLTTSATLGPDGLFAKNTGFVAALAAAGYMLAGEGEELGVHLYTQAAEQGVLRLGDMHRIGVKATTEFYSGNLGVVERLQCFSLVGDPALVYRHDVTAMGTDTAWLAQHGQTSANADLEDPDGDGWRTWQEFQADTNPTGYVFQVVSSQLEGDRMTVAFDAVSNGAYGVEYKSSLMGGGEWQPIPWGWTNSSEWFPPETAIVPQGPVTAVALPVSGVSTQGFYRMRGVE